MKKMWGESWCLRSILLHSDATLGQWSLSWMVEVVSGLPTVRRHVITSGLNSIYTLLKFESKYKYFFPENAFRAMSLFSGLNALKCYFVIKTPNVVRTWAFIESRWLKMSACKFNTILWKTKISFWLNVIIACSHWSQFRMINNPKIWEAKIVMIAPLLRQKTKTKTLRNFHEIMTLSLHYVTAENLWSFWPLWI